MRRRRPSITVDAALRDLTSASRDGKLRAVEALIEVSAGRREEACRALRAALSDTEAEVRMRAAIALGKLGDAEAREALSALSQDPEALARQGAIIALGELGVAREAIERALADPEADVRYQAVIALASLGGEGAGAALLPALEDSDAEVRGSAAAALADLGQRSAVDAIAPLLEDTDRATQLEAALSLSRLDDARGLGLLGESLADREWGLLAAEQIFRRPHRALEPTLSRTIKRRFGDKAVAVYCAAALARLGRPLGRDALLKALASKKAIIRGLAISTLGQLGEDWALDALRALGQSEDGEQWSDEIAIALARRS